MKKIICLAVASAMLSGCQQSGPAPATKQDLARIQSELQGLSARMQQIERSNNETRSLLDQVSNSRLVSSGVRDALRANSNSGNAYQDGVNAYRAGNVKKP